MKKLYSVATEDSEALTNKLQILLTDKFLSMDFEGNHKRLATTYKHFVKAFEQATADGVISAAIAKKAEEMINPYPNGKLAETRDKDGNLIFTQDGDQIFFGAGQEPDGTLDAVFDFDDDRDEGFYIWFKMNLETYADSIAAIEAATRAQEPPEGVSAAAPVPSIPPAEIAADAGKKNKPLQNSTAKESQGEDSMKQHEIQEQISKIGQADSTTDAAPMKTAIVTQQRIAEAEKFFNLLFGNVHEEKFGYLWTKQDKRTYPFAVSKTDERREMARKAIELNDAGFDVYYGVNLMDTKPAATARVKAEHVTLQTATVTDIDVLGGSHTDPNKYPPTFDAAKSFLPFAVSILVDSGYGMHGLCLYSEPINITAENRDACKARNNKFIAAIRSRAGNYAGAVDGVGDLPRVLRVPGTFNYKLGKSNAPMCRIVEISDLRFTPADMDGRLDALTPARTRPKQEAQPALIYDSRDFDIWRASQALETIPVSAMSRDEWLNIGMALKNNGNACTEWEQWSRNDERFKIGECENLWRGFNREGLTIATIIEIAMRYGYDAKAIQRQWFELHPELSTKISHRPAPMDDGDGEGKVVWTQDRIKSCPANLRLPADFTFSATGITQRVKSKKDTEDYKYLPVTKTPIVPTRIFFDPIKGTDEYEIAILSRGKWRRVEVEARILGDARALNMLCDYGALIIENSRLKNFFAAILAINPDLTEIKTYKQTGWTDSNFTTFAYPTGGEDYIVRRDGFNYKEDFKAKGNAELWKQKFKEVSEQGGAVARAFIGTALAAPLARPLNFLNPQAHLNGKSGSGKTALQKFVASIFGNPRKLIRTFAATNKNRLLVAAAYCDLPTFLDELETIQGKAAEEALSNDVYNFADGKGNQANRRDGTARETFEFGSSRLTTGERPILKQHDLRGAYKRLIQLDTTKGVFDDEFAADLHIFSESNFGHFGETWIRYIVANMGEIQKQYHHFAKFKSPKKYEPTQIKSVAAAIVAFEFFSVTIGLKSEFDKVAVVHNMRAIVDTLPDTDELDDTARAIEFLQSFSAGNDKFFVHEVNKPEFDNEFTQGTQTCYGKIFKNGEVAFLSHAFKKILEDEGGFKSSDKLRAEFGDKGYLRTYGGKCTYPTWFNGKVQKMIRFVSGIISTAEGDKGEEETAAD